MNDLEIIMFNATKKAGEVRAGGRLDAASGSANFDPVRAKTVEPR
jgi:hypothetical protein